MLLVCFIASHLLYFFTNTEIFIGIQLNTNIENNIILAVIPFKSFFLYNNANISIAIPIARTTAKNTMLVAKKYENISCNWIPTILNITNITKLINEITCISGPKYTNDISKHARFLVLRYFLNNLKL